MPEKVSDSINVLENAQLIKELRKKNKGLVDVLKEARHVICFVLFLSLFTYLVLVEHFIKFYAFEKSVRDRFDHIEGSDGAQGYMQLSEVENVEHLWTYLNTTVADNLYFESQEPNSTYQILKLDSNSYNLVMGRTRLRVVRVAPNVGCKISEPRLLSAFENCYGNYDGVESEDIAPYTGNQVDGERFQYMTADVKDYNGVLTSYSANGYMKTLGANYTDTKLKLDKWKHMGFFDTQTRAIFVDFNIYNANAGFYGATKLVFEVSPAGKFVNTFEFTAVTDRYIVVNFDTKMILEMFLILFVAYYIAQELSEFTISKSDYLSDGWNLVDWFNLILLLWVTALRFLCFSAAGSDEIFTEISDLSRFTDLSDFASYIKQVHALSAFNAALVWFKTVKYIGFIPYVTTMMSTIRYSYKYFCSFAIFFLTIFIGFSLALTSGFGDKITNLSSFTKASLFLGQSLVGSSDFGALYELGPILAGFIIFLFVVLIFFIMLNLFIAVMVVALSSAKAQDVGEQDDSPWAKFMIRVKELKQMAFEQMNIDMYIQLYLPGLHQRRKNARDAHSELILRRQQRKNILDMRKKIATGKTAKYDEGEDDGGPSSPITGRMKIEKSKKGTTDPSFAGMGNVTDLPLMMPMDKKAEEVDFSDSDESDVDIGILSNVRAKQRRKKLASGEATESELIFQSVQHLSSMLARRSDTVKLLVLNEMKDVKMICGVVADVVEILGRRAQDLAKQQQTFIDRLGY